jgi:hypothetical protein
LGALALPDVCYAALQHIADDHRAPVGTAHVYFTGAPHFCVTERQLTEMLAAVELLIVDISPVIRQRPEQRVHDYVSILILMPIHGSLCDYFSLPMRR